MNTTQVQFHIARALWGETGVAVAMSIDREDVVVVNIDQDTGHVIQFNPLKSPHDRRLMWSALRDRKLWEVYLKRLVDDGWDMTTNGSNPAAAHAYVTTALTVLEEDA